jgi:hypothetical protein
MRANSVVKQSKMEHYQVPKEGFFRMCEGYVRSKALDLKGNDYDNEWHKGL